MDPAVAMLIGSVIAAAASITVALIANRKTRIRSESRPRQKTHVKEDINAQRDNALDKISVTLSERLPPNQTETLPGNLLLNVEVHGRGKGRPVVALHGFVATLESWRGLVPLFADREVWLFDLKGHGASPCPDDGKYTVQDHADLILARISKEDMRGVTLVGHSFGGGVALLVASALIKEGAGCLASLVLIDSLAFPEGLSGWARLLRAVWALAYVPVPLFAISQTVATCAVRMGLRIICRHPENLTAAAIHAYAGNLRQPARASALIQTGKNITEANYAGVKETLNVIDVPTLIVWGRQDPLVPLEPSSGALHDGIKGSKLIVVDDCGHIAHEEQPAPLLEQIAAFLAQ